jgi:hypothetical protein
VNVSAQSSSILHFVGERMVGGPHITELVEEAGGLVKYLIYSIGRHFVKKSRLYDATTN